MDSSDRSDAPSTSALPVVLLTLAVLMLWLVGVREYIFLGAQLSAAKAMNLSLPDLARRAAPVSLWLSSYWYVCILFAPTAAAGIVLISLRVFRKRSSLLRFAWALLMIFPPLAFLEMERWASHSIDVALLHGLRAEPLDADQLLPSSLVIREVRRVDDAKEEVLAIDGMGGWRMTRQTGKGPEVLVRSGKLTQEQQATLARHMETLRCGALVGDPLQPEGDGDFLSIDLGFGAAVCPGLRRDKMWPAPPNGVEGERWSKVVLLVLAVDDMVRER